MRFACLFLVLIAASVAGAQSKRQQAQVDDLKTIERLSDSFDQMTAAVQRQAERIGRNGRVAAGNARKLRHLGGQLRSEASRLGALIATKASTRALQEVAGRVSRIEGGLRHVNDRIEGIARGRFTPEMAGAIDAQIRGVLAEAGGVLDQLRTLNLRVEALERRVGRVETRVGNLEQRIVTGGVFGRSVSWGVGSGTSVSGFSLGPAVSIPLSSAYPWTLDITAGLGYGGAFEGHGLMLVDVEIAVAYHWRAIPLVTGVGVIYGATVGFFDHRGDVTPTTSQVVGAEAFIGWAPTKTIRLNVGLGGGGQGDLGSGHGGSFIITAGGVFTF